MSIYKLINTTDGNQIYVTDLARMAQNTMDITKVLPFKQGAPILCGGWYFSGDIETDTGGACIIGDKMFTTEDAGYGIVEKGVYLYARASVATIEPRTSSTGQSYNQYVKYELFTSPTPLTPTNDNNYFAELGLWTVINGAQTATMSTEQYGAFAANLLNVWNQYNQFKQMPGYINNPNYFAPNVINSAAIRDQNITPPKISSDIPNLLTNIKTIKTLPAVIEPQDYGSLIIATLPLPAGQTDIFLNTSFVDNDIKYRWVGLLIAVTQNNALLHITTTGASTAIPVPSTATPTGLIMIDIFVDKNGRGIILPNFNIKSYTL